MNHMKSAKTKRKYWILKALLLFLLLILLSGFILLQNPRVKLFLSSVYFSGLTLNNPSYIAYHVDLMELCRDYINDDIRIDGTLLLDHVKDVGFSMHLDVNGDRSHDQKRLSAKADLSVISIPVGDFYFYAEDEMIYFIAPKLKNLSYAFDTEMNLFFQAPQLTNDIDAKWFSDHMADIRDLTEEIGIEETGDVIDDGGFWGKCKGYRITIPEGSGGFIWELLDIDAPDHDIVAIMYFNPIGRTRRIYVDLTEQMADSTIVSSDITIDGYDCGTILSDIRLVDNESVHISMVRNGSYNFTNYVDTNLVYETNTKDLYDVTGYLTWDPIENGVRLIANDYVVKQNDAVIAEGYFDGNITKTNIREDLFAHTPADLYSIDILKWKELKNDMDDFIKDVEQEVMDRL